MPDAFPGVIFKFSKGKASGGKRECEALRREYGVECGEYRREPLYIEVPWEEGKRYIEEWLLRLPPRIVIAGRESPLLSLLAEPGWREYSPLTVLFRTFYDEVESYRLEQQAFFPGKSPCGVVFAEKKREGDARSFLERVKAVFRKENASKRWDVERFEELL